MKKAPPTPDPNAAAPRPRHQSDEDAARPTMDQPPPAPSDTSTSFDRATAATDQIYRSGLLPGSDDVQPEEPPRADDDDSVAPGRPEPDRVPPPSRLPPEDAGNEGSDVAGRRQNHKDDTPGGRE